MDKPADRRSDIQGLRAIAVLSVVIYHASAGVWPTGGFVGVDVFFVISGFLITGILLRDIAAGRFSLTGFYRRRIRRLFPVLLTVLAFTMAAGAALLSPASYRELAATAAATMLFVSNFAFVKLSSYFDDSIVYKPLTHTWSLAVEEQFYIFFPMLLAGLSRWSRRSIGPVVLALAFVSLAASVWMTGAYPSAAFYLLPARAFELLTGALLACHPRLTDRLGQRWRDVLSLLGLLLIAASVMLINDSVAFPGAVALVPCLGAALVIGAGQPASSLGGRMISLAPFVLFGDISYALYLWHWPLLALARNYALGPIPPSLAAALAILSVVMAYASWRWIERPFIRGLPHLRPITMGLAMIGVVTAACGAIFVLHGLPQRFGPESLALFAAREDYNRKRPVCHNEGGALRPYSRNCMFGSAGVPPTVAIWADSHGTELAVALGERMARTQGAVLEITASSCPPSLDYQSPDWRLCAAHNAETLRGLAGDPRVREVVMLANFVRYSQAQRAELEQGFAAAVHALRQAGKSVVIFEPIPVYDFEVPSALGVIAARGGDPSQWGQTLAAYRDRNAPFLAMIGDVAAANRAVVIRTADLLCRQTLCATFAPGEGVLYFNGQHLSVTGARRLALAVPLTVAPAGKTASLP